MKRPDLSARNTTHGLSRVQRREYRTWKDMRRRCNAPANKDYPDYGGRGIRVCERWDDFAAFYADMGDRPSGMAIDRIDVNDDYAPDNCRWATAKEQANNKRSNHRIEFQGETKTLQQWCNEIGIEQSKVRYRLKIGMPVDRAFSLEDFRR